MSADSDGTATRSTPASVPVHRVKTAYDQVADQLRGLILQGDLNPGTRLPTETALASQFGVSRATVREALRVLASQRLVRTSKGAGGGSFVTLPTVDHISEFLQANINILTEAKTVSLEEFLELREVLEIPAARLAALYRHDEDITRMRGAIPPEYRKFSKVEQFQFNKEFHSVVAEASGNTLLFVAAQPIFSVLQIAIARSNLGVGFSRRVHEDHELITAAIEAGDPAAAEEEMRRHLAFLRPEYEKAWIYAVEGRAGRR